MGFYLKTSIKLKMIFDYFSLRPPDVENETHYHFQKVDAMRTTRIKLFVSMLFVGIGGLTVAGCGGGDTVDCGEGTEREGTACVPVESGPTCGAGTEASTDGECVVADQACGDGLIYNADADRCVPDRESCRGAFDPSEDECVAITSCGSNATLQDGECVADTEALCGEGAVSFDEESGRCVVSAEACGNGTEQASSGSCVVAESGCGEGLALSDDGTCEPTESVCDDGTVFAEDSGLCLPEATCESGDVILDTDDDPSTPGICVTEARLAAEDAVAETDGGGDGSHNDPALGGSADEVNVPEAGMGAVNFKGTIAEPSDLDGENGVDQDRDVFQFDGEAGAFYKVSLQSLGIPSAWFEVTGPNGFEREAFVGGGPDASRYVRLPEDGDYQVTVVQESLRDRADDSEQPGPAGNSDWKYVGAIEQLDESASSLSTAPNFPNTTEVQGNAMDLRDNLYSLEQFSANQIVRVSVEGIGQDVDAHLQLWSSAPAVTAQEPMDEETSLYVLVPSTPTDVASVMVDWSGANGPDTNYTLRAETVQTRELMGSISSGGSASSSPADVNAGDTATYAARLPGDHVIEVLHDNDDSDERQPDIEVLGIDGDPVYAQEGLPDQDGLDAAGEDQDGYFYVERSGVYLIEFTANDSISQHEITVKTHDPTSLGEFQPGASLSKSVSTDAGTHRSNYFTFSVGQAVTATIEVESTMPGEPVTQDLKLHDLRSAPTGLGTVDNFVAFERRPESEDSPTVMLNDVRLKPGTYLLGHGEEETDISQVSITGSFGAPGPVETEPNDRPVEATDLPADDSVLADVEPGDRDRYSFQVGSSETGQITRVLLAAEESTDGAWNCVLTGPAAGGNGRVQLDSASRRDKGCLLRAEAPRAGTYRVRVDYSGEKLRRYFTSREWRTGTLEQEPNNRAGLEQTATVSTSDGLGIFGAWTPVDTTDRYALEIPSSVGNDVPLFVTLTSEGPDELRAAKGEFEVIDSSGSTVASSSSLGSLNFTASGGSTYTVVATAEPSAIGEADGEYSMEAFVFLPDVDKSKQVDRTLTTNNQTYTSDISVSGCSQVTKATVDVNIEYNKLLLEVAIVDPDGNRVTLWGGRFTQPLNPLSGNFPLTLEPEEAMGLLNQGTGNGTWTLEVTRTGGVQDATWNSWGLRMLCN